MKCGWLPEHSDKDDPTRPDVGGFCRVLWLEQDLRGDVGHRSATSLQLTLFALKSRGNSYLTVLLFPVKNGLSQTYQYQNFETRSSWISETRKKCFQSNWLPMVSLFSLYNAPGLKRANWSPEAGGGATVLSCQLSPLRAEGSKNIVR